MAFFKRIFFEKGSGRDGRERRATPRDGRAEPPAASGLALATIGFCETHGLTPTPIAYEVIWTHLSGENAALSGRIAAELRRGELGPALLEQLHDEFLHAGRLARGLGSVGRGLGREVEAVSGAVSAGIEGGGEREGELARLTAAIAEAPGREALQEHTARIRAIGQAQLAANLRLREALHVAQNRLLVLENELLEHIAAANTDHLTKLPNRRALQNRLAAIFSRPFDLAAPACLIMVDIDNFKQINDQHGHDIGDNILRKLAEVLSNSARPDAFAGRWGGEEFLIVMEQAAHAAAVEKAERIRRTLEAFSWTRRKDGGEIGRVTASFGVAERRGDDTPETLAKRADAALYRAKDAGRNRTFFIGDSGDRRRYGASTG